MTIFPNPEAIPTREAVTIPATGVVPEPPIQLIVIRQSLMIEALDHIIGAIQRIEDRLAARKPEDES